MRKSSPQRIKNKNRSSEKPVVSIVIVSWNVIEYLAMCLDSIKKYAKLPVEVVVVDNDSADNTVNVLLDEYPWVKTISMKNNKGFAGGNNRGFREVQGEYIFLLNPDTQLEANALERMIDFLEDNPRAGIVGPKLCNPDGSIQIYCARLCYGIGAAFWCGALRFHVIPGIGKWFERKFISPYDLRHSQEVEAISGAAMLARKTVIEELEGLEEEFIHSGEDLDFCFRAAECGYKIWYIEDAVVTHHFGQSSKKAYVRTAVNSAISDQTYFRRCYGQKHAIAFRLIVQFVQVPTMLLKGII